MKSLAVFCGSKKGILPEYTEAARQLGLILAQENIELIYGGGNVGLMGVIADTVMENSGKVTGIIPEKLMELEVGHQGISELIVVKDMHERKALINKLSDGFLCLPGGIGTLEEIFEVFTWGRIGYHQKPCALYNVAGFYNPLVDMLTHTTTQGFMSDETQQELLVNEDIEALLQEMQKVHLSN
ncbi:MAG: TIGR00730 family Rossman fold protein [Bacteroidota bacterium]